MAMDTSDQHHSLPSSSSYTSSSHHHSSSHGNSYHHGQSYGHKDKRSSASAAASYVLNKQTTAATTSKKSSSVASSSSAINSISSSKMCRSTSINGGPVITYGLRHESLSNSKNLVTSDGTSKSSSKSLIFVKLTDSSLKAIEEYIKAGSSLSCKSRPTIQFEPRTNHGVISIPSLVKSNLNGFNGSNKDGTGDMDQKRFNFSVTKATEMGPKGSFECIRHSSCSSSSSFSNLISTSNHNRSSQYGNTSHARFNNSSSRLNKSAASGGRGKTNGGNGYINSSDEEEEDDRRPSFDSDDDGDSDNNGRCDSNNTRNRNSAMPIDDDNMMDILGQMDYKMTISATEDSFHSTKLKMSKVIEESQKNMTKVIKESGPKVGGRKAQGFTGHGKNHFTNNRMIKSIGHNPPALTPNKATSTVNGGGNNRINDNSNGKQRNSHYNSNKSSSSNGANSGQKTGNSNSILASNKSSSGSSGNGASPWNSNHKRSNCDSNNASNNSSSASAFDPSSKKVRSSLFPSSAPSSSAPKVPSSSSASCYTSSTNSMSKNVSPSMPVLISCTTSGPSPTLPASVLTPPPSVPSPTVPPSGINTSTNGQSSCNSSSSSIPVPLITTPPEQSNLSKDRQMNVNPASISSSYSSLSSATVNSSRHSSYSQAPKDTSSLNYTSSSSTSTGHQSSSALITKGYSDLIEGWANKPVSPVVVTVTAPPNSSSANENGFHQSSSQELRVNGWSASNGSSNRLTNGHGSSSHHSYSGGIKSPPSVDSVASTSSSHHSSVPSPPEDDNQVTISPPKNVVDKNINNRYNNCKVVKKVKAVDQNGHGCDKNGLSSLEERNRLKKEFDDLLPEYKCLQAVMDTVTRRFTRMEKELRNTPEGSRDWNRIMELILKEYDDLKKDEKYRIQKKRHSELHAKLSKIKQQVLDFDARNSSPNLCQEQGQTSKGKMSVDAYKRMQKEAASANGHGTVSNGHASGAMSNGHHYKNGCEVTVSNGHGAHNGDDIDMMSDSDGGHFLSEEDDDDMSGGLSFC